MKLLSLYRFFLTSWACALIACSALPTSEAESIESSARQGRGKPVVESCLSIDAHRGAKVAGMIGGPEYPGLDSNGKPIVHALWRGQKFISFQVDSVQAASLFYLEERPIVHTGNHTVISQTAVWGRNYAEEIFPCESKKITCGYQSIGPDGHYAVCAVKAYCYYLGKTAGNPRLSFSATGNDVDIIDMSYCEIK